MVTDKVFLPLIIVQSVKCIKNTAPFFFADFIWTFKFAPAAINGLQSFGLDAFSSAVGVFLSLQLQLFPNISLPLFRMSCPFSASSFLRWSDVHAWHRWQFAIWIVRFLCCHTHTWRQWCRLWTWRVMLTIRPCSGHSQRYTFVWYLYWSVIFRSNRSTGIAVCENSVWHMICGTKFWIDATSVQKAAIIVLWLTSRSQKCQMNWLENRWSIWALQSRNYIQMRCIHSAGEYLHSPVGQICKGQWKDVVDVWVPRPIFSKLLCFCEGRKASLSLSPTARTKLV